jgi:hypothetical protein
MIYESLLNLEAYCTQVHGMDSKTNEATCISLGNILEFSLGSYKSITMFFLQS